MADLACCLEKEQKSLRKLNNYRSYDYLRFHYGDLID